MARKKQDPIDALARRAVDGDVAALDELLRLALRSDPNSGAGKALRRRVTGLQVDQARRLVARAVDAAPTEAEALRDRAREQLYRSVLVERVRLVPPSEAPAEAVAATECLLDPPPDAPGEVIAASTGLGARVVWQAPNDHGKAITRYDVTVTPRPLIGLNINRTGTEATVTGLLPATAYTFTVTATNADGPSPASQASNVIRTEVAPPKAPAAVTGKTTGAVATVEWTPPASGAPFTAFWVTAYDAGTQVPVAGVGIKKVAGDARSVDFDKLPKGTYVYGVRAFNSGGFGDEARSGSHAFAPAPTPFKPEGLPLFNTDPLDLFDLGSAKDLLDPERLRRRLGPALEKANKWRYEHLKGLAVDAAQQTLGYEQLLAQVMQMTLGKVSQAQQILNPALVQTIKDLGNVVGSIKEVATSGLVKGVVDRIGDAASTALALEGLLFFLLDESPLDFWVGLFDGIISDVARFDTDLERTTGFLFEYFGGTAGARLIRAVQDLVTRIDAQVDAVVAPIKEAVDRLAAGIMAALRQVISSIQETVVAVSAIAGADGQVATSPFPVIDDLVKVVKAEVDNLRKDLIALIRAALKDPTEILVTVIKVFVVYPILGIFVVSFALGPIGAGIIAAIVLIAAVELIRLVARLLAGPLLDSLNDARDKVVAIVGELQGILSGVLGLVESAKPDLLLQQAASLLQALEQLVPREFVDGVASLIGEARRALLSQATELALAAERALGLENATAFDVVRSNYDTGLPAAPGLPGGADRSLLAGLGVLRDLNLLDRLRVRLLDGKEVVVTQRLSLFRLLGGLGDPIGAVGTAANEVGNFLRSGKLLVKLSEAALLEQGYPGLYRAMVVDIKPIGLLAAASPVLALLPGIPLSITHLGPSRMRVKRNANPAAPPIGLPSVLQSTIDQALDSLSATSGGVLSPLLVDFAAEIAAAFSERAAKPDAPQPVDFARDYVQGQLPARLLVVVAPIATPAAVSQAVQAWLRQLDVQKAFHANDPAAMVTAATQEFTDKGPGLRVLLAALLTDAHRRALESAKDHVSKWAGARYEEDRDPQIQALGYVTLVQEFPVETAVFNLVPDLQVGAPQVGPQAARSLVGANSGAQALQYRPFENRGVEGEWLLNLEGKLSPGTLVDLLLEVTVRGCYDESLAAAVKAQRDQTAAQLDLAKATAARANKVLTLPGALPDLLTGASEVRTIHFSLRSHRDNLLKHALAAVKADDKLGGILDGIDLTGGNLTPLGAMDPFRPIGKSTVQKVTLKFQNSKPDSFAALGGVIPVTPDTLSIAEIQRQATTGTIVGMGLAIIPSREVTFPPNGKTRPSDEQLALRGVAMDPLLATLLGSLDATKTDEIDAKDKDGQGKPKAGKPQSNLDKNRRRSFFMTMQPPAVPVSLSQVFNNALGNLAEPPRIELDLGDALNEGWIHDVIFSLSVRIPVAQLNVSPAAI